jgi:hypothetical protein
MLSLRDLDRQLWEEVRPISAANGVDILEPHNFVSIVRGRTGARMIGPRRESRIEVLTQGEPGVGVPAAIFGSRALGWLDTLEVVLIFAGTRNLTWKRNGKQGDVLINGRIAGRVELGFLLQHAHIGSGRVWFDGDPFCEIALPFRGPASPQKRDCTGRFTFTSDRKSIKFLLNPKQVAGAEGGMKSEEATGSGAKWRTHTPIFDPADETRLACLSADQRLLLLALSLWPWSTYKVGEVKAVYD